MNTDSRYITEWLGNGGTIPNSDFYGGCRLGQRCSVRQERADLIITSVPTVTPAYSASHASPDHQASRRRGRRTTSCCWRRRVTPTASPVYGIDMPHRHVAPMLCNKDVWAGIAALLDSGEKDPDRVRPQAGRSWPALPVILPPGFTGERAWPDRRACRARSPASIERSVRRRVSSMRTRSRERSAATAPSATGRRGSCTRRRSRCRQLRPRRRSSSTAESSNTCRLTPADYADPLGVYHSFSGASGDHAEPDTLRGHHQRCSCSTPRSTRSSRIGDPRAGRSSPTSRPPGQPTSLSRLQSWRRRLGRT